VGPAEALEVTAGERNSILKFIVYVGSHLVLSSQVQKYTGRSSFSKHYIIATALMLWSGCRYVLKVTISRSYATNIVEYKDFWVLPVPCPLCALSDSW
jgi:hypothetical protein